MNQPTMNSPTIRLVLADDHAVVRAGIANALRELPNLEIVGEAGDGTALFAMLVQARPDVLVTDVTMPDFEPIGTIRQIRAAFPALKILIVSAYDDDVYVQGLLGAGVNGYHLKDQPLSDLRLALQRVLAGERWVCSPLVDKLVRYREVATTTLALTARQRDILRCLKDGLDNHAIARRTGLSVKTIENHLTRLYRQINVQSRLEAVTFLRQHPEALGFADLPIGVSTGASEAANPQHLAILIVDDNLRYRTQMRRMVGKTCPNAAIYEAENTQTALKLAGDTHPQLAFIDVVLGDEHGIELARQMHALSPSTRMILISAYPDREFRRLGLAAGAVAFLDKKDIDAAALRALIDDLSG
ncbi:MAG: response regulator transcription factor [Kouleothrix sp.]|jgi:DNA-binding NarL/FixJ family response regulator